MESHGSLLLVYLVMDVEVQNGKPRPSCPRLWDQMGQVWCINGCRSSSSCLPSGGLGKEISPARPPPCLNTCILMEPERGEKSCQSQHPVTSATKPAADKW